MSAVHYTVSHLPLSIACFLTHCVADLCSATSSVRLLRGLPRRSVPFTIPEPNSTCLIDRRTTDILHSTSWEIVNTMRTLSQYSALTDAGGRNVGTCGFHVARTTCDTPRARQGVCDNHQKPSGLVWTCLSLAWSPLFEATLRLNQLCRRVSLTYATPPRRPSRRQRSERCSIRQCCKASPGTSLPHIDRHCPGSVRVLGRAQRPSMETAGRAFQLQIRRRRPTALNRGALRSGYL